MLLPRLVRSHRFALLLALLGGMLWASTAPAAVQAAAPPAIELASNGQASVPIMINANASDATKKDAATFAQYLDKITGGTFKVQTTAVGQTSKGILFGTAAQFPDQVKGVFDTAEHASKEQYLLRSTPDHLLVIGVTDLAVQEAMWDMLHHLGYRQFFPSPAWEVIPDSPTLSASVDTLQKPDYDYRRIWPTYNTWPENRVTWGVWNQRNRMGGAFGLNSGHAYGNIIRKNQTEFDKHPEYYALVDGKRQIKAQAKLCVSNAEVRKLVVAYADQFFQDNPNADSISVDPSDGGNWCQCDPCAAIGTPSDLALTLANSVSKMIEKKYPGKFVAMYGYNYHSPPPTKVHARPRVIITVATAFIHGGLSFDQILQGWRDMGVKQFGVRDYYSIIHWDKDLPHAAKASRLYNLASNIRKYHQMGAKYTSAESSENFGPNGLGYYIATRVLWDTSQADHVDDIINDFLTRAFKDAKPAMRDFYNTLTVDKNHPRFSEDLIAKLYESLDKAHHQTKDPKVLERINELVLYVRYLELYRAYTNTSGKHGERLAALELVIRHSYRMRHTMLVHSLAQYRTGFRDKGARIPAEAHWQVPEGKNPWKSSEPWTQAEYDTMLANGVKNNHRRSFEELTFGNVLVPATPLQLKADKPLGRGPGRARANQVYLTWLKNDQPIHLKVTSGLAYTNRGPCKIDLEAWDQDTAEFVTVDHVEVPQDKAAHDVTLKPKGTGLYRVVFNDRTSATQSTWPDGLACTVEASSDYTLFAIGRRSGYFYVPKGTKKVGLFNPGKTGYLADAQGQKVLDLQTHQGYVSVPVPPGHDGKLWSFHRVAGRIQLLTVPPYVAGRPELLLLPSEVVDRDRS